MLNFLFILIFIVRCNCETALKYTDLIKNVPDEPTSLSPEDFLHAHSAGNADLNAVLKGKINTNTDPLERAGKFEGDIDGHNHTEIKEYVEENNYRGRNAIRNPYQRWPNGIIPYVLSSRYGSYSRRTIARAMNEYKKKTCVRFKPRSTERDYIYIHPEDGCYSLVGRVGGRQPVSLDAGCISYGTILHELMHTVGFFHEQSRNDRDDYITIVKRNLVPKAESQFEKYSLRQITHLGTPYDYGSIMHYSEYAFSKYPGRRSGRTIIAKISSGQSKMGNRRYFSKNDLVKINKLYKCTKENIGDNTDDDRDSEDGDTSSTGGGGGCRDTRWDCRVRKFLGYCKYDRPTRSGCKKTCSLCDTETDTDTGSNTVKPTPAPSKPKVPDSGSGETGTDTCRDKKPKCVTWAGKGYCTKFRKYMASNCPKACRHCGSSNSNPDSSDDSSSSHTTTKRSIEVKPISNGNCINKNSHCRDWASDSQNFCKKYPLYMRKTCPKACGICTSIRRRDEIRTTPATACKDLHRKCSEYKEDGYCTDSHRDMMQMYCKKSCNLC